jgi:hypothetical protein
MSTQRIAYPTGGHPRATDIFSWGRSISSVSTPAGQCSLAKRLKALLVYPALRSRFGAAGREELEKDLEVRCGAVGLNDPFTAALRGDKGRDACNKRGPYEESVSG